MRRLLPATVLALSAGLFVAFADDKKDAPDAERAQRLKALKKKFNEEFEELQKRFEAATDAATQAGIRAEGKELAVLTAGKVVAVAEGNPKDEVALDAIEFLVQQLTPLGATGPDVDKAVAVLIDHHLNDPRMKDLVQLAGGMGAAGEKLLRAAAEKSADKEVRGISLYILGDVYAERADDTLNPKKSAELAAQAIEFWERAAKEAPDAKIGMNTLAQAAPADIRAIKTTAIGEPAPDVEGVELRTGRKVKLSSYRGQVVLLDFWATWCGPCRAMIPHSRKLVDARRDKPFVLVSVSGDKEKEEVEKFVDKNPMRWTHWWDGEEGPVQKTYRAKALPTLYLIDAKGVIRKKWVGVPGQDPDSTIIDEAVDELLREVGR